MKLWRNGFPQGVLCLRTISRGPWTRRLLAAGLLSGSVVWPACTDHGSTQTLTSTELAGESTPRQMLVATRRLEPKAEDLRLPARVGRLQAREHRALGFEVAGRLVARAETGDRVQEGDILARLDRALEQSQLRRARLELDQAVRELERVRGLRDFAAASRKALDAASTAVELRRTEVDIATERLSRRALPSPFSGVVGETTYDPGEVVSPGEVAIHLLDLSMLTLEIGVPGAEVTQVARGARVDVELPGTVTEAGGPITLVGSVVRIAPSPEQDQHLYEVEVLVPNPNGRLRPGMPARARTVRRTLELAFRVPLELVVERAGRRVVFFADEGRAHAVDVGDAELDGDELLLPADDAAHRELIVRGQRDLREGAPLRIDETVLALLEPERAGEPGPVR